MTKTRITILSVLLAILLCVTGFSFAAVFAAEEETVLLDRDGTLSATTQDYQAKLQISPWSDGSYSYQMRATQIEIVFREPLDASWAQNSEHQVLDNVYLDFWIFSTRPQTEAAWSGDNQIEIASDQSNHDYNEYHWTFSDVVWQQGATGQNAYIPGKWNHARLKLTNSDNCHVGEVDLSRITYFRMYYLFNTTDFGPVFISDVKLTTGEADQDVIGDDYMDAPEVVFPNEVAMPEDVTEGDTVTFVYPNILDLNGSPVASSNIRISTTGPNGFVMEGSQIVLEDGYGIYTTTYTVTNLMGVNESRSYSFEVAAADADRWAPRVLISDDMPADFIVMDESKGDVPHTLEDYITITDNRGWAAMEVSAKIVDESGAELISYEKASGADTPFALEFAPDSHETYTLRITAQDAAGLSVEREIELHTYLHAREDLEIDLFNEETGSLEFLTGGYYSGRLVDAHPQDGSGKSLAFHYEGGATDTSNNELARQEMVLMNNLPADVSEIDMRWAAIRLNIYIDRTYAQDSTFMSADGQGYGNMGIGFPHIREYIMCLVWNMQLWISVCGPDGTRLQSSSGVHSAVQLIPPHFARSIFIRISEAKGISLLTISVWSKQSRIS